jgi:DNA-directed RNA polymerase sigma subunit (sigma70/sigma32)
VIVLRFSEKPLRLREIGEMLDLSKERVRQIERDGLRRLNRLLRHSGVAPVAHGP